MERLPEITKDAFLKRIAKGNYVVYFGADWCRECQYIRPKLPAIEHHFPAYKFLKADRDENTQLCLDLEVRGLPSFIGFHNGEETGRFVNGDLKTQPEIENWIRHLE
ncbi:thioredoxin family protein [Lactiplantibacillus carotarum]|uniref:thioredoxin family protein n=1 Tax=Lactiplantibacillus carotarum TaxID=2993456 RepID=UPI00298F3071|nr:thioredoxin family protein [Lactiplantibacillus carotarum]